MSTTNLHFKTVERRAKRTRMSISGNKSLPRLSVQRSLRHIHVQIIDDLKGVTLLGLSDLSLSDIPKGATKTDIAKLVGARIATKALEKKITAVRFDRGAYRYHGRVSALADAAREAGLTF